MAQEPGVGAGCWTDHELDGMYSQAQGIVLLVPGPQPRAIATLIQWDEDVADCRTRLRMRRRNLADLGPPPPRPPTFETP